MKCNLNPSTITWQHMPSSHYSPDLFLRTCGNVKPANSDPLWVGRTLRNRLFTEFHHLLGNAAICGDDIGCGKTSARPQGPDFQFWIFISLLDFLFGPCEGCGDNSSSENRQLFSQALMSTFQELPSSAPFSFHRLVARLELLDKEISEKRHLLHIFSHLQL